ncbi:2-C-methyl-D-erythritol 4-phosphate cytidylyltransferase [bacterium]|nr:2-C-methyl-D-erythritol 4-phosphate cytidylyltransferase [FCB group bacterium]MBL7190318.1 2-C-methyl-D-erythritol 4-phosphate cytidylyltransferase [bacterium]
MPELSIAAVIAAGGAGTRMGGDVPKQFRMLNGQPLIMQTLKPFYQSPHCLQIVVAAHPDWKKWMKERINESGWKDKVKVVTGGKERGDSVYSGLKALNKPDIVLIHDAVRPFINEEMMNEAAKKAWEYGGAAAAVPILDTIKREDEGIIKSTVNRTHLYQVQTPQAFRYNIIMKAYRIARKNGFQATDDCMLLEKYTGIKIKLVPGSRLNIKITEPEDFILAEAIAEVKSRLMVEV